MPCQDVELRISLHAFEELEGEERAVVEAHLESCASCRAMLERERRLLELVKTSGRTEPSPALLASCRNALSDALDAVEEESFWRRLTISARPTRWFTLHPAWGAALCVVVGVVMGTVVPQLLRGPRMMPDSANGISGVTVSASPVSTSNLENLAITDIHALPGSGAGLPMVKLSVRSEEPRVLEGSLNDADVKRVLTFVVQNNERFDSGLRLDSVDLLKNLGDDAEVRQALRHAARRDSNPGVRLKAIEALSAMGEDEQVRQTVIDALLRDENPGVRVVAINALRAFAESAGEEGATRNARLVEVLRDRMQRDPNTYVRMQSAAAMRQLGARATY